MFYKYENDELTFGPCVTFPTGEMLHVDFKDTYTYPVEGYYYFATEQEAKDFFGITDD